MTLHRFRWFRSRRRSHGQSLAEFAIVFPILMLVIGGIIQLGIFFWGQNTINQVVRDTGRWAATQQGDCVSVAGKAALTTSITTTANSVATNSALLQPLTAVTVTWTGAPCPPTSNQQEAWVHITMDSNVPIFFPFVPGGGVISSQTQFRMEPVAP
jgi:Flp pilus assembly protein TadG